MENIKQKLKQDFCNNIIMLLVIAKYEQEYLQTIINLKHLIDPREMSVIMNLKKANENFIARTDKTLNKSGITTEEIDQIVYQVMDGIYEKITNATNLSTRGVPNTERTENSN